MLTFLTLLLWFGGLLGMLAGHLLLGGAAAVAGAFVSGKALSKQGDMESFFGVVGGLLILAALVIGVVEGWAWLTR